MDIATTILGILLLASIYFNLELFKKGLKASEELDSVTRDQRKCKQECLNLTHNLNVLQITSKEKIDKLTKEIKCVCEKQVPPAKTVQKKQVKKPVIK